MSLTAAHRRALTRNATEICKKINIGEELINKLLEVNYVITKEDAKLILEDKTQLIREILPRRSDAAFMYFVQALIDTNQSDVAKLLDAKFTQLHNL